jgi:hypothetical protein
MISLPSDRRITLTPTYAQRMMRQVMDADYYYPEASDAELAMYQRHNRKSTPSQVSSYEFNRNKGHCLEVLRTTLLCYPDLNLYPYLRSMGKELQISVSAEVTRKCVDWEALQKVLALREVKGKSLMVHTGPVH